MRIWWLPPLGKSPFDVYSAWLRVHHGVEHWELEHQVLKQAYRSITVFFEAFFQLLTDSSHKGEANPRGQSAWKHKYLTTYFQLCASLNSHKKRSIFSFGFKLLWSQPCWFTLYQGRAERTWVVMYSILLPHAGTVYDLILQRLLDTKWQHSKLCFCDRWIWIFQKQDKK